MYEPGGVGTFYLFPFSVDVISLEFLSLKPEWLSQKVTIEENLEIIEKCGNDCKNNTWIS